MKKYLLTIVVLLLPVIAAAQQRQLTADEVIRKTIDKLGSLKTVSYDYRRELNYSSEKYHHELKAAAYFDLTSGDKILGARFQFTEPGRSAIFNGSELFYLQTREKTILVNDKTHRYGVDRLSYLVNSPLMLKNVLPTILKDTSIPRSVSLQNDRYVLEFALEKFGIDLFGNFSDRPLARKLTYQVTISAADFMPLGVLQKNGDVDFIKTEFTNISEKPLPPAETTWFYSTYLGEYKHAEPQKNTLILPDTPAPDFRLPLFGKELTVSLAEHRGKVILLEFFIFHCGYSIAAVPQLNALNEKYKNKDFKLFAVNMYDSKELVDLFIKSKGVSYLVLFQAEKAVRDYGVFQYPTAVLIGKDGKILYAGTFDAATITELIDKNL